MTNVTATHTESASGSIEQFGYRQELKRSLSLFDLVVYGLIFIVPLAPFTLFGILFNMSNGMVPLVYTACTLAMGFTALSYVTMSSVFPIAGSVYSYAARGIGETAGFLAGWAILLDYVLIPVLANIISAVAIQAVIPSVPRFVWIIPLVGFITAMNLLGIETTARLNKIFLALQFALIGLFMILASLGIANGVAGAHFSIAPLFKSSGINLGMIFGAVSVAVFSIVGFDAISTLSEEARGGARAVGRATLLALAVGGILFVTQTYFASLFVLDRMSFAPGQPTDAAFYGIAAIVGGSWFLLTAVVCKVFSTGVAGAMAAQTGTARLLFSMARDGKLPHVLAHVNPKRKVPDRAILLCAAVNLILGVTMANQLALLVSMVSFGALTGFLLLHLSVIVHFMWRQKSKQWLKHLLVPLIGFAVIAYVLINMPTQAKIAGIAWLSVGVVALIGLRLRGKQATLPA